MRQVLWIPPRKIYVFFCQMPRGTLNLVLLLNKFFISNHLSLSDRCKFRLQTLKTPRLWVRILKTDFFWDVQFFFPPFVFFLFLLPPPSLCFASSISRYGQSRVISSSLSEILCPCLLLFTPYWINSRLSSICALWSFKNKLKVIGHWKMPSWWKPAWIILSFVLDLISPSFWLKISLLYCLLSN